MIFLFFVLGTTHSLGSNGDPSNPGNVQYFEPAIPMAHMNSNTQGEWDFKKALFYPSNTYDQNAENQRIKRDAAGALKIQTNHALPIHADVKSVSSIEPAEQAATVTVTEKVSTTQRYNYEESVPPLKHQVLQTLEIVSESPIYQAPLSMVQLNVPELKSQPLISKSVETTKNVVTPPEDSVFEIKSLRKSLPLPNKIELIRSINRVMTIAVLVISAVIEFYPLMNNLYHTVYNFVFTQ